MRKKITYYWGKRWISNENENLFANELVSATEVVLIKYFFAIQRHLPWAKLSDINGEGLFVFVHTCRRLSPCCKPHWGIAPTRHPAATSETAVMDPIQSRSITIQTRMSAVKTLSISCQVFARSLGCNEVLINNSWLSLIFNGSRLHDTLLDEEKRKRQIWRHSIIYIKDLFFVSGGETVRSWNQREESVDGGIGSQQLSCLFFFFPKRRKPEGPISNSTGTVGHATCQVSLQNLFRSQRL